MSTPSRRSASNPPITRSQSQTAVTGSQDDDHTVSPLDSGAATVVTSIGSHDLSTTSRSQLRDFLTRMQGLDRQERVNAQCRIRDIITPVLNLMGGLALEFQEHLSRDPNWAENLRQYRSEELSGPSWRTIRDTAATFRTTEVRQATIRNRVRGRIDVATLRDHVDRWNLTYDSFQYVAEMAETIPVIGEISAESVGRAIVDAVMYQIWQRLMRVSGRGQPRVEAAHRDIVAARDLARNQNEAMTRFEKRSAAELQYPRISERSVEELNERMVNHGSRAFGFSRGVIYEFVEPTSPLFDGYWYRSGFQVVKTLKLKPTNRANTMNLDLDQKYPSLALRNNRNLQGETPRQATGHVFSPGSPMGQPIDPPLFQTPTGGHKRISSDVSMTSDISMGGMGMGGGSIGGGSSALSSPTPSIRNLIMKSPTVRPAQRTSPAPPTQPAPPTNTASLNQPAQQAAATPSRQLPMRSTRNTQPLYTATAPTPRSSQKKTSKPPPTASTVQLGKAASQASSSKASSQASASSAAGQKGVSNVARQASPSSVAGSTHGGIGGGPITISSASVAKSQSAVSTIQRDPNNPRAEIISAFVDLGLGSSHNITVGDNSIVSRRSVNQILQRRNADEDEEHTGWYSDETVAALLDVLLMGENLQVHTWNSTSWAAFVSERNNYALVPQEMRLEVQDIVIPVHAGNHWVLVYISTSDRTIYYLDSMHNEARRRGILETVRGFTDVLEANEEHWVGLRQYAISNVRSEQQRNSRDCGVYLVENAVRMVRSLQPAAAVNTITSRQTMVRALLTAGRTRAAVLQRTNAHQGREVRRLIGEIERAVGLILDRSQFRARDYR